MDSNSTDVMINGDGIIYYKNEISFHELINFLEDLIQKTDPESQSLIQTLEENIKKFSDFQLKVEEATIDGAACCAEYVDDNARFLNEINYLAQTDKFHKKKLKEMCENYGVEYKISNAGRPRKDPNEEGVSQAVNASRRSRAKLSDVTKVIVEMILELKDAHKTRNKVFDISSILK